MPISPGTEMPPEFEWQINTILDGTTGQPFVGLSLWYQEHHGPDNDDTRRLVATWQWTIPEARHKGMEIMAAAEASEADAHLIMALRENKMPEDEIQRIVERVRINRGSP